MIAVDEEVEPVADQRILFEPDVAPGRQRIRGHDDGDIGLLGDEELEALLRLGLDDGHLRIGEELIHLLRSRRKQSCRRG